jgi:hypothetical protein
MPWNEILIVFLIRLFCLKSYESVSDPTRSRSSSPTLSGATAPVTAPPSTRPFGRLEKLVARGRC